MIILALLILLAIVCAYSWLAYRIKTTGPITSNAISSKGLAPKVGGKPITPTVPKPLDTELLKK